MEYRSVKGFTGVAQFGFLLVFVGLGFILAGVAQIIIGYQMVPPGTSFDKLGEATIAAMKDPKNIFYSRLAQVTGTFFLLFVPAMIYNWLANGKSFFWLGFNRYLNFFQVIIGFLILFTCTVLGAALGDISKTIIAHLPSLDAYARKLENLYNDQVLVLSNLRDWPEFLMAIVVMAFFPALFEEVFFRGVVQNLFVKWWKKPLLAIIATSLLFSLVHGSVYLFLTRAVLGFALGMMYHRTKNIWTNVIAHFLNNAIALVQLFAMSRSKQKVDISKLDPKLEWWYGLIAIAVLFFLFRFLDRYSAKNIYKINAKENLLLAEHTSNPFTKHETNQVGN